MKVAVGSMNPVKIEAVRRVFTHFFDDVEIIPVKVESGISDMPLSDQESLTGARNRALNALKEVHADCGVGLEGHVHDFEEGMMLHGFVAIADNNGNIGYGDSGGLIIPNFIAKRIRNGEELGTIMDELEGEENSKQKEGAVGYFSKGYVKRADGFEMGTAFALSRFLHDDLTW